ncbi:MAG: hypothetical protein FWG75_10530 [Cystobacterineae bacterium]|nr:hypothetical protein [Cystobacterineae bacterium]
MLGMLPRRGASVTLAVLALIFSVAGWLLFQGLGFNPYLVPAEVLGGALWQPLTWLWLRTGAFGVLLSTFLIWILGSQLELLWGRPRFWYFCISIPLLAGIFTLLLALGWPALSASRFEGGGVLTSILWVALGLEIGKRPLNFFGFALTGYVFAGLGLAFILLEAIFGSPVAIIPSLLAVLLSFLWVRWRIPGGLLERYSFWRLKRRAKLHRKRLNLLSGGKRNTPSDSDRYLH